MNLFVSLSPARILACMIAASVLLAAAGPVATARSDASFNQPGSADAFSCDAVSEIQKTECIALVALYNSTYGVNWANKTDWLQTNTPCKWYGVGCAAGQVNTLSLGNNRLAGPITPE